MSVISLFERMRNPRRGTVLPQGCRARCPGRPARCPHYPLGYAHPQSCFELSGRPSAAASILARPWHPCLVTRYPWRWRVISIWLPFLIPRVARVPLVLRGLPLGVSAVRVQTMPQRAHLRLGHAPRFGTRLPLHSLPLCPFRGLAVRCRPICQRIARQCATRCPNGCPNGLPPPLRSIRQGVDFHRRVRRHVCHERRAQVCRSRHCCLVAVAILCGPGRWLRAEHRSQRRERVVHGRSALSRVLFLVPSRLLPHCIQTASREQAY